MKHIKKYPIQKDLRELFNYQDGKLIWKVSNSNRIKIGEVAGTLNKTGYIQIGINGLIYLSHRLIYIWHNGDIPDKMVVDHINSNPSNNCIKNLQLVTQKQNQMKKTMQSNNVTGYRGVHFDKTMGKFKAQISIDSHTKHLGYFNDPESAAIAYDIAALEHYKDFAQTNFPRENYQIANAA